MSVGVDLGVDLGVDVGVDVGLRRLIRFRDGFFR